MHNEQHSDIHDVLTKHRPKRLTLTAVALILAALANLFFWGVDSGLAFFAYVVIFITIFTLTMWRYGHLMQTAALWLLIPIGILSLNVARFETNFVNYIVPLIVIALIIIYCSWLTLRNKSGAPFHLFNVRMVKDLFLPFSATKFVIKDLKRDSLIGDGPKQKRRLNHIIFGLAIGIPLVLLFIWIFSSADPIFKQAVIDFWRKLDIDLITFWRVIKVLFWTILLASVLYFFSSSKHEVLRKVHEIKTYSSTIVNTVLWSLNGIFLLFIYIQVRYLFIGGDIFELRDITYAEYAREGFFQLLVAVFLVAAILAFLYRTITRTKSVMMRALAALLCVFTIVVCFSALKRMGLYQAEFGLTLLRVYVAWTILTLVAMYTLGVIFIAMRLSLARAFVVQSIIVLAALMAFTSVNVERHIVNTNIDRYLVQGKVNAALDTDYLVRLSNDSVPTLFARAGELTEEKHLVMLDLIDLFKFRWQDKAIHRDDWRAVTFSSYFAARAEEEYGIVEAAQNLSDNSKGAL